MGERDKYALKALAVVGIMVIALVVYTSIVSSEVQSLGPFKQLSPVYLVQSCANSTYSNVTRIQSPNGTIYYLNSIMTKNGIDYNITMSSNYSSDIGRYITWGICDINSVQTSWAYDYYVSPSGNDKPNSGEGISLAVSFLVILAVAGFFILIAFMSNNQIVKSMFIGLSAFIMAVAVFLGMTNITQTLGGFNNLITGYNTFFFFILLVIVMAVFTIIIYTFVKSLKQMKINRGQLDPDNFQP